MGNVTRRALLVVDVQNDFCPGGALSVPKGDEVVEPINEMIDYAIINNWLIIYSRDWHPAIAVHFAIYGGKWPVHCVQNTEGAKFHPKLRMVDGAIIISKGTEPNEDAYSAFDGHTEDGKTLLEVLKESGIEEVFVCGLATDYCVKYAAIDAVKKYHFKTYVLLEACRAVNVQPDDEEKAIQEMKDVGVVAITIAEVLYES